MVKKNIIRNLLHAVLISVVLLFISLVSSPAAFAQLWDYPIHPDNPFQYHHLDLKLELDVSQGVIKGEADYTMSPYLDNSKTIILQANRIDVHSVWVNGKQIPFDFKRDSLVINLPESFSENNLFHLKIIYEAQPVFGLNQDSRGSYWTSLLPMTSSHIFPVFDNPLVSVTTNIRLIVPIGYSTVSNGSLVSTKAIKSGWKEDTWHSGTAIPVTDIGFAVGYFDHSGTLSGIKKIQLFSEKGILSTQQSMALLNDASQVLQKVQVYLKMEFPWPALNLVVLKDDHWEKRSAAASFAYIYKNRGELKNQIARDIYAQWFGTYQRSEQYAGADAQIMMQAWLQWSLNHKIQSDKIERDTLQRKPVFYDIYDTKNWLRWQQYFQEESDSLLPHIINKTYIPLVQQNHGVMNWEDYARFWYQNSGYWLQKPVLPQLSSESKQIYQFTYKYDAVNGRLTIYIDTLQGHNNELITLPLLEYNSGITKTNITFSGVGDTVSVKTKPGLLNVNVRVPDSLKIKIVQKKPISFWFYQLRKGTNAGERAEAAIGLGDHTGDPDLQLALVDNMNKENTPKVKAAIITSLAKITQGATGTDQLFTGAMKTKDDTVRMAIVEALRNYPGDGNAIMAIRNLIRNSTNAQIVTAGLRTLQIIDHKGYADFARTVVSRDSNFVYSPVIMKTLMLNGDTALVQNMASHFIESGYPYVVRVTAIRYLAKLDKKQDDWKHWIAMLVQDNDPRIRYIGWGLTGKISPADKKKLIDELAPEENDLRVLIRIRAVSGKQ